MAGGAIIQGSALPMGPCVGKSLTTPQLFYLLKTWLLPSLSEINGALQGWMWWWVCLSAAAGCCLGWDVLAPLRSPRLLEKVSPGGALLTPLPPRSLRSCLVCMWLRQGIHPKSLTQHLPKLESPCFQAIFSAWEAPRESRGSL